MAECKKGSNHKTVYKICRKKAFLRDQLLKLGVIYSVCNAFWMPLILKLVIGHICKGQRTMHGVGCKDYSRAVRSHMPTSFGSDRPRICNTVRNLKREDANIFYLSSFKYAKRRLILSLVRKTMRLHKISTKQQVKI